MSTDRRIKWGIAGTHWISATMAAAMIESETSEVVAIASRDPLKAQQFANQFSIPRWYQDSEAMLADSNIDAVYIGLPNHLHKEWIIRCAKAGKHILCEKPLVLNEQDAREVFSIVEKNQVVCMEGLMYRHHPYIMELQSFIEKKVIGDIQCINATYACNIADVANPVSGGAIRNLGCYPLSLIRLLLKQEPVKLLTHGRLDRLRMNDNIACATLVFPNDIIATITTSNQHVFQWRFDIIGSQGTIRLDSNPWFAEQENRFFVLRDDGAELIRVRAEKSLFTYQVDAVNAHIIEGRFKPDNNAITWEHSIGNAAILNQWVKLVHMQSQ